MDKVERLYLCNDVNNISINVGVIENEPSGGIAPGEKITKEPIEYIQYHEFDRDKVASIDWKNLNRENYYKSYYN